MGEVFGFTLCKPIFLAIMTQHYRMTLNSAITEYQEGIISSFGLLYYYFKIRFAPGWKIRIDPQSICKELGLSKDQFYRALRKIKEKFPQFKFKTISVTVGMMEEQEVAPTATDSANSATDVVDSPKPVVESTTPVVKSATNTAPKVTRDKQLEDSPNFSSSSFQSFLLSLSTKQRESFLVFGKNLALSLPKPPVLIESWIEKNYLELAKQCPDVVCLQPNEQQVDYPSHPKYQEWLASWKKYPVPFAVMDSVDGVDENYQPLKWVFGTASDRDERKAFAAWAKIQKAEGKI
jgi:hypothetical protein